MKEKKIHPMTKFASGKVSMVFGLLLVIALLVAAFFVLQPDISPLNGMEANAEDQTGAAEKPVADQQQPSAQARNYEKQLPFFVHDCADKNPRLQEQIRYFASHNPFFVRGDFDGDRKIDYAITVESRKTGKEGLLICFRDQKHTAVLLGLDADNPPPFWRLVDWDVNTPAEVARTTGHQGRPVGIRPSGEAIVMYWEDAVGFIYWDGGKFRWKQVILNKGG